MSKLSEKLKNGITILAGQTVYLSYWSTQYFAQFWFGEQFLQI